MRFYRMNHVVPESYALLAVNKYNEVFVYLANTSMWHRATYLDGDCFFEEDGYVSLTPGQVVSLMPGVRIIPNEGWGQGVLQSLMFQGSRGIITSNDMGLSD